MARIIDGFQSIKNDAGQKEAPTKLSVNGVEAIEVPGSDFVTDAVMTRDGQDLVLESPDGEVIIIENYFLADPAPTIISSDGSALTPQLVGSFTQSEAKFTQTGSLNDESPVGAIEDVKGDAVIIRADGSQEPAMIGTPIYQGDVIETSGNGAANIVFLDETSMAVSENARFAINEYTFDPSNESGTTNFSVLRGVFVFTSGLIGREDPDDVEIETPVGSIGIRGTVIAGNIKPGGESEITVLEGAIVIRNGFAEKTLSMQFETVKLSGFDQPISEPKVLNANDVGSKFGAVKDVAPTLFSSINDNQQDSDNNQQNNEPSNQGEADQGGEQQPGEAKNPEGADAQQPSEQGEGGPRGEQPVEGDPSQDPQNAQTQGPDGQIGPEGEGTVEGSNTDPFAGDPILGDGFGGNDPFSGDPLGAQGGDGLGLGPGPGGTNGPGPGPAGGEAQGPDNGPNSNKGPNDPVNEPPPFLGDGNNNNNNQGNATSGPLRIDIPNAAQGVSIIGDNIGNRIGHDIAAIGDANNDGFADFMFTNNTNAGGQNHSYIMYGSGAGIPSDLVPGLVDGTIANLSDIDADPGEIGILGNGTVGTDASNTVIASIGDYDGDGTIDYIVGQQGQNSPGPTASGNVNIISGATGGSSGFTGLAAGDMFGASISAVGDYNNDGYDDFIIGAPNADGAFANGGKAYLVYGGMTAIGTDISETSLLSANGMTFEGGAINDHMGTSVSGAGDFDGDSRADIVIGTPGGNRVTVQTSINTIDINHQTAGYDFGHEVMGVGDMDGDGLSDIMAIGNMVDNEVYFIAGGTSTAISDVDAATSGGNVFKVNTGPHSILGGGAVGDWNGDGFDDFAFAVENGPNADIYVAYGQAGLFANTVIDLNFLNDPLNAFKMVYEGGGSLDFTISGTGDVNGDGFDDLAIGVENFNGSDGQVIVVEGRRDQDTYYIDDNGFGDSDPNASSVVADADDLTYVGNTEFDDGGFLGSSYKGGGANNTIKLTNDSFFRIDGGLGNDIIEVGGGGTFLDFGGAGFEDVKSIEKLQFTDNGQTVRLTLENIFNFFESSGNGDFVIEKDAITGETLIIDVDGDAIDDVAGATNGPAQLVTELNANSTGGAFVHSTPTGFNAYTIGGNTLYIQSTINVDVQ